MQYETYEQARESLRRYIIKLAISQGFGLLPIDDLRQEAEIELWQSWARGERRSGHLCRSMMWRIKSIVKPDVTHTITGADKAQPSLGDGAVFLNDRSPSFDYDAAEFEASKALQVQLGLPEGTNETVSNALNELTATQRQVYVLLYVRGWSAVETAKELGMSQPAVTQMNNRIKSKIKKLMGDI